MADEFTSLLGRVSRPWRRYVPLQISVPPVLTFIRTYYVSVLTFMFCFTLTVTQILFQTILVPQIVQNIPPNIGLLTGIFSSEFMNDIIEWTWVFITDDLDRYFHDGLFGTRLSPKQLDALRKTSCLDTVLQILTTKILLIEGSLAQACWNGTGGFLAIIICVGLTGVNVGSRVLWGQLQAITDKWEETVRRNNFL